MVIFHGELLVITRWYLPWGVPSPTGYVPQPRLAGCKMECLAKAKVVAGRSPQASSPAAGRCHGDVGLSAASNDQQVAQLRQLEQTWMWGWNGKGQGRSQTSEFGYVYIYILKKQHLLPESKTCQCNQHKNSMKFMAPDRQRMCHQNSATWD